LSHRCSRQRGYDKPAVLSYAISSFCATSADGLQASGSGNVRGPLKRIGLSTDVLVTASLSTGLVQLAERLCFHCIAVFTVGSIEHEIVASEIRGGSFLGLNRARFGRDFRPNWSDPFRTVLERPFGRYARKSLRRSCKRLPDCSRASPLVCSVGCHPISGNAQTLT
jgi:hypothetical protein